ncbi:SDR family NAD(P)-dependent oxidoreductase [Cohnella cellulosilytica]|uniref:SDR family NAD(P)-dependent oxidoreductase n=1 Tax=Cohnella cellulosilytica TaxID=986710 RepID=UPI00360E4B25
MAAARTSPLHGLICNAGVQYSGHIEQSEDGYEATFAVNYLGHFLLTNSLVEYMARNARIIVLSSITHDDQAKTPLPKPVLKSAEALANPFPQAGESIAEFAGRAYSTSKLCILMFAYELERRLSASGREDIAVNAFDPGGMLTGMTREWKPAARWMMKALWPLLRLAPNASTPRNSAKVLAEMAVSERYRGISGKFYSMIGSYRQGAREKQTSAVSYDKRQAQELWEGSERLIEARK